MSQGEDEMQKRTLGRSGLEENLGAAGIHLKGDDLREIDQAASQIEVQGARYPEPMLKMVGR
jgi:hypothetical protein